MNCWINHHILCKTLVVEYPFAFQVIRLERHRLVHVPCNFALLNRFGFYKYGKFYVSVANIDLWHKSLTVVVISSKRFLNMSASNDIKNWFIKRDLILKRKALSDGCV